LKLILEIGFVVMAYDAERLARAGSRDEGDVVVKTDFLGSIGILECKAPGAGNAINLSGWTKEAQIEATHYAEARGIDREAVLPASSNQSKRQVNRRCLSSDEVGRCIQDDLPDIGRVLEHYGATLTRTSGSGNYAMSVP
jgi:hypothetical protein